MDANEVAMWRDAALTLLAIQAIVLSLLPAVAIYWGLRGMHRLVRWIRPVLFETRLHVWRIQREMRRGINAVVAPFVWLQSAVAGVQRALQILGWR